jgi:hypothetical protein
MALGQASKPDSRLILVIARFSNDLLAIGQKVFVTSTVEPT